MMDKQLILEKAEAVVNALMNLGGADYEADKNVSAKDAIKTGMVNRDFGIEEWDWPQGVGLYGLLKLQHFYGNDRYGAFLEKWYQDNIAYGLPSKNINTTAPFLTLHSLCSEEMSAVPETSRETYKEMCLKRAQWLMDGLARTKEGGFQHVTSAIGDRNGVILNESQMWMDTLFMAVLFLNRIGVTCYRADWSSEALHQVLMHIKYLYDKQTGLFYHGWSFDRNDNFGGIFWCRGNSWFTYGITEYLDDADGTADPGALQLIADTFRAHADALRKLQAPSGLWHTVLDDPTSYEETSGSAAIAAGLLHGIRSGLLDESYRECAERAVEGILAQIGEDGIVQNVSAGTGMGMDAEHYKHIVIHPMAYGQSLTLIALVEALELE